MGNFYKYPYEQMNLFHYLTLLIIILWIMDMELFVISRKEQVCVAILQNAIFNYIKLLNSKNDMKPEYGYKGCMLCLLSCQVVVFEQI